MKGPTNPELRNLIQQLKEKAISTNQPLWKRIATDLESPSRNRRAVNLSRISRYAKKGEIVIVPGKVLASGELEQDLTIAAWQFSGNAREKIESTQSKTMSLSELMKSPVKGKNVRIIG
jgi:large subunit ribosomal protein L18e